VQPWELRWSSIIFISIRLSRPLFPKQLRTGNENAILKESEKMTRPLIGITTYGRDENNRFTLRAEYVEAIRRAGGLPVLMPPGEPQWEELFMHLDGLLLAGGGDIDPALYGGVSHQAIYKVDPERDQVELALARNAVAAKLPTLGICRGSQVINVALGGTLIEHLPDEVGDVVPHRLVPGEYARHPVTVTPSSHLSTILGQTETVAASSHHQAIRSKAPSLRIVAQAADGVIEAVEMTGHPWLIAVQWHPEITAADDLAQQRLFDAFVKAAASRKK
jgi:putative glutamine amidotransferase